MKTEYTLAEVIPYINWVYFFHAWGMSSKPQAERDRLQQEALERLDRYANDYRTFAVCQLFDAYSEGDDIVVSGVGAEAAGERIPCLRQQQQGSDYLCLADFIAPKDESTTHHPSPTTQIGIFATSVSMGLETDFEGDPYEKMMMQLLADRLAEATAERMHEQVRRETWGYGRDEPS